MTNLKFHPRTYTPMKAKKNYFKRKEHEDLLRKLYKEVNRTELKSDLSYPSDNELLISINGLLRQLGCVTYNEQELLRELSLKN